MPFGDRMHDMGVPFFHYSFLGGRLVGSENPAVTGSPRQVIGQIMADSMPTLLLSLTPTTHAYAFAGLSQKHLPMVGLPRPEQVRTAIGLIGEQLVAGRRVWVHCQHGIDRTGCVIGACLVSQGEDPDHVIAALLQRFPPARRQPRMVELWQPYADLIHSFRRSW